jgi:hypothetical protein
VKEEKDVEMRRIGECEVKLLNILEASTSFVLRKQLKNDFLAWKKEISTSRLTDERIGPNVSCVTSAAKNYL